MKYNHGAPPHTPTGALGPWTPVMGTAPKEVKALVQARMNSERLPGKVMMQVLGKPLLGYELERLARAKRISEIIVATTVNGSDDVIAEYAASLGFGVWRGPEEDVLERYYAAAVAFGAEVVVRLTADCPLIDPETVDRVADALLSSSADYASNTLPPRTYPRGLDAEAFTFAALEKARNETRAPYDREHVTPYLYDRPEIFTLKGVYHTEDLSHHRWTVDTKEDFTLIEEILKGLYPLRPDFSLEDVLLFMAGNSRLFDVNSHVRQKSRN